MRRWDPVRDLMSIQNEMNRLFSRQWGTAGENGDAGVAEWIPAIDIYQDNDRLTVVAELPGMNAGDVDITVEENVLTIKGERKFYDTVSEDSFHRVERRFGTFLRRVALPQHADSSRIEAAMENGLLRIDIPKAEQAKPRRVEVRAGTGPRSVEAEVKSGNSEG